MTGPYAFIPQGMATFDDFGINEDNAALMLTWIQGDANSAAASANPYDPFTPTSLAAAVVGNHQNQLNPYAQDATAMTGMGGYYQGQGNFTQPVRIKEAPHIKLKS
jgi:hypothetical protein